MTNVKIKNDAYTQAYNDFKDKLTTYTNNTRAWLDGLLLQKDAGSAAQQVNDYKFSLRDVTKQLTADLNELPLTKTDYDALADAVSATTLALRKHATAVERKLDNKVEDNFKAEVYAASRLADHLTFPEDAKRRAFDVVFDRAYADAHANGYHEVRTRYDELEDMVIDALRALRP